jgi:ATP synthase protein I
MQKRNDLEKRVDRQARRIDRAERERPTLMAQTVFVGTLGLVFVLPVIAGAYLGRWLDGLMAGYSIRWTVSLILLGVITGAINVYLLIRE